MTPLKRRASGSVGQTAAQREQARLMAAARRLETKHRKRVCVACGVEEDDKKPFVPHPDGIGPVCAGGCDGARQGLAEGLQRTV